MALKLPDSAVPMGDFPVAKAVDIDFNDGENLQEKLDNGKLGGAGGGDDVINYIDDEIAKVESALNQYPNIAYYPTYDTERLDCDNITDRVALVTAVFDSYAELHYPAEELLFIMTSRSASSGGDGVQKAISWNTQREWNRVERNGVWSAWTELATQKDLDDLFQSVSSGKTLVANAITDKGVSTATDATFATMASNISKINTNGYKEETASWNKTSTGANRIVFTFSADVYGVKQITPPSDASSNIVPETSTSMFTINGRKLTLYVNGVGTWKVTAIVRNA